MALEGTALNRALHLSPQAWPSRMDRGSAQVLDIGPDQFSALMQAMVGVSPETIQ